MRTPLALLAGLAALTTASQGAIVISEFMYNSVNAATPSVGEFVEFTNTGSTSVDMTGWSFDDNSNIPGSFDVSAFGVVQPGQTIVLTDATASEFRTFWGLSNSVVVVGGNTQNLGRSDAMYLYDAGGAISDFLIYNDQATPAGTGGPRTQGFSATVSPANYGLHNPALFTLSVSGVNGATTATTGDVGSPGTIVPEASTLALAGIAALGFLRRRRA